MNTINALAVTNKVQRLLEAGFDRVDLSMVTNTEKLQVISELKRYATNEIIGKKLTAEHLLVELGDEGVIGQVLHDYKGDPVQRLGAIRFLKQSKQPSLIPHLARDLNLSEPTQSVLLNNEFVVPPYSVSSAQIIRAILTNAPQFSMEVKDWATQLSDRDKEALRSTVREWWVGNSVHFQRQTYSKVKPGRAVPEKQ